MTYTVHTRGKPFIAEVVATVAAEAGLSKSVLLGRSKKRVAVWPRQVAMVAARTLTGAPKAAIGRYFKRDHTLVIEAERRVRERCAEFPAYTAQVVRVFEAITALRIYGPPTKEQLMLRLVPRVPAMLSAIPGLARVPQRRKRVTT